MYGVLDDMRDSDSGAEAQGHYEEFLERLDDTIKDYSQERP